MPKFRDLGINAIPMTMQPPQVGGGGYRMDGDTNVVCAKNQPTCDADGDRGETNEVCGKNSPTCAHRYGETNEHCEKTQPTCGADVPDRGETNLHCAKTTPTCARDDKRYSSSFTPDVVAQLKQQLDSQIST